MASAQTKTSYLILTSSAVTALRSVEPLFSKLISVTKKIDATYDFISESVRAGYVLKQPIVNATAQDVATFLSNLSGQNVSAGNIADVKLSPFDAGFVEVYVA